MDNVRPQNVRISILGGLIEEISTNGDNTLVTISYSNCPAWLNDPPKMVHRSTMFQIIFFLGVNKRLKTGH